MNKETRYVVTRVLEEARMCDNISELKESLRISHEFFNTLGNHYLEDYLYFCNLDETLVLDSLEKNANKYLYMASLINAFIVAITTAHRKSTHERIDLYLKYPLA